MKSVQLVLQTFSSTKRNIHILLLIDNSTTTAYINHKGGTHSRQLSDLAVEIWKWCISRGISIHAEHIPGVSNTVADAESRKAIEPSNWMLNKSVFNKLQMVWGPFNVDLFAARHNRQLPRYFSFKPCRPRSRGGGCSSSRLVEAETLCLSSIHSDREVPSEDRPGSSEGNGTLSISMAQSNLVPRQVSRSALDTTKLQGDHHEPPGRNTSDDPSE